MHGCGRGHLLEGSREGVPRCPDLPDPWAQGQLQPAWPTCRHALCLCEGADRKLENEVISFSRQVPSLGFSCSCIRSAPQSWLAHFGRHLHVHMHACEALGSEARATRLFTPEHLSCENVGWDTDDAVPHCSQDDHNTICLQARSPTGHALYGASTL